jgi:hypothetical protein
MRAQNVTSCRIQQIPLKAALLSLLRACALRLPF